VILSVHFLARASSENIRAPTDSNNRCENFVVYNCSVLHTPLVQCQMKENIFLIRTWSMVNMPMQNSLLVCSTIDCIMTQSDWNTCCTRDWSVCLDSEAVIGPNQPRRTGRSYTYKAYQWCPSFYTNTLSVHEWNCCWTPLNISNNTKPTPSLN